MIKLVASLFHSLSSISLCSPSHSLPVSKTVSFCRQIVRLKDTTITRPPPKRIQIAKDGSRYVSLVKMETVANSRCFVPFFDLPHYISSLLPCALSLRFLLFISFLWAYWIIKFHFIRFLPALWWAWLCQRNVYATKVNERRQYKNEFLAFIYSIHSLTHSPKLQTECLIGIVTLPAIYDLINGMRDDNRMPLKNMSISTECTP